MEDGGEEKADARPQRRRPVTTSAGASRRTPRASSTSADPTEDDAARLPCLATGTPHPATAKAAIVETLTLCSWSPPVPTTSIASGPMTNVVAVVDHRVDEARHLRRPSRPWR